MCKCGCSRTHQVNEYGVLHVFDKPKNNQHVVTMEEQEISMRNYWKWLKEQKVKNEK